MDGNLEMTFTSVWLVIVAGFAVVWMVGAWKKAGAEVAARFRIETFVVLSATRTENGMRIMGLCRLNLKGKAMDFIFNLETNLKRVLKNQIWDAIRGVDPEQFAKNTAEALEHGNQRFVDYFSLYHQYEADIGELSFSLMEDSMYSIYGHHKSWSGECQDVAEIDLGNKDEVSYYECKWS